MIARKIRKSPIWLSLKAQHRLVMLELLLQAQWQDGDVVRNGEIIHLKRGQVATSYQQLVDDIGEKEITVKVVRTAIDKLERAQFLAKDEAVQRAKKGLLLTIDKYGFYQDTDNYKGRAEGSEKGSVRAEQGQSEGRVRAINNKENNNNNDKNEEKESKKRKKKTSLVPKIFFAEFVSLTADENAKLLERFGPEQTKRMIDILDNYKGATGKKYECDYRAILNWVVKRYEEEMSRGGNGGKFTGSTQALRSGGDTQESKFAFLNVSSPSNGPTPYDPDIF